MDAIDLTQQTANFDEPFRHLVVNRFNGMDVQVARISGPLPWHEREEGDDFFLVLRGELHVDMRHDTVRLGPGEMLVVPRGIGHRPLALGEAHVLRIEPASSGDRSAAIAAARRVF